MATNKTSSSTITNTTCTMHDSAVQNINNADSTGLPLKQRPTATSPSAAAAAAALALADNTSTADPNGSCSGVRAADVATGARARAREEGRGGLDVVSVFQIAASAGCGVVFGLAAEKAQVYLPEVIRGQMIFSQFPMLKMFLSAVIAGIGGYALLQVFPATKRIWSEVRTNYASSVSRKSLPVVASGAFLLGMGMTLAGSCPGMVILQVGTGMLNSIFTLLGCFTGALLYSHANSVLENPTHKDGKNVWLDRFTNLPYWYLALPLGLALSAVVGLTEWLKPWSTDVQVSSEAVGVLQQRAWSPIISGIMVGSLQIPLAFILRDSLGGSSSYCTVLAQSKALTGQSSYFRRFKNGIGNWWQVAFWAGAMGGAALSANLSGTWGGERGVAPLVGFLGGAFMLFGARMASGCTSGHGISGFALLANSSLVAVPCMFGGAISLAVFSKLLL